MWLLLNKDISKTFNSKSKYTYLFPIYKNNFFIGKNDSGKSYFSRFLMKNTIKIYNDKDQLIEDIFAILKEKPIEIKKLENMENKRINEIVNKFLDYENMLEKIDKSKMETGVSTISTGSGVVIKEYKYIDSDKLFEEIKPLLRFLNLDVGNISKELNSKVIPEKYNIQSKIKNDFFNAFFEELKSIPEEEIYQLGDLLLIIDFFKSNNVSNIKKFYIPVIRSIRHPEKNINIKEEKEDIYKNRCILEYQLDEKEINVITGLEFYKNYKNDLLGSKEKRKRINEFENFLSQYFFDGENISIIPDEKTFELKININDLSEDRFIYEVGDGISSLLIIAYTLFIEADKNNKLFFIEEPETSFHPSFQKLLINIITYYEKFKNCIFFFTTHSNHLIDIGVNEVKNSTLLLCKKEKNNISIDFQNESYNEILEELGVQASSVRIANKIIWVEGKYDALYIRLLLNLKNSYEENKKKYIEDYDYCFVPYGGSNMELIKFDLNQEDSDNEEFILRAEKINSKYMIILDDDNMSKNINSNKAKRYKRLKEKLGEKIYKLEVREIENLFPEEVLNNFIKNGLKDKSKICNIDITYNEYKNKKLGKYINDKIKCAYKSDDLKTITGRNSGFELKGFLYNKQKFYDVVLKWIKKENFNYENDVTYEAKNLIDVIEKFIEE